MLNNSINPVQQAAQPQNVKQKISSFYLEDDIRHLLADLIFGYPQLGVSE